MQNINRNATETTSKRRTEEMFFSPYSVETTAEKDVCIVSMYYDEEKIYSA
jgi:hypothetical protein